LRAHSYYKQGLDIISNVEKFGTMKLLMGKVVDAGFLHGVKTGE
jgi:hypothetical protein